MDQVSRPLQVLLVAAVLFLAVWLVALRPKGESGGGTSSTAAKPAAKQPAQGSTSPAQGPGSSLPGGLGRAVTKARGAAGQSDAANQRVQQATGAGAAAAQPATPRAAAATGTANPAPAPGASRAGFGFSSGNAAASSLALATGMLAAGVAQAAGVNLGALTAASTTVATPVGVRRGVHAVVHAAVPTRATASPTAVRGALANGKVVVLLFWNPRGADDQLVRAELSHVSSHGGRAFIVAAPVREVSRFSSVIRGVQVLQSPTVLVIDPSHRARMLVGYTDRAEIGQSVSDAVAQR